MVKSELVLDSVFTALSNPVRRQTLDALRAGSRSVSELAAPHAMSLVGFTKHLRVLRAAGLVSCSKEGRTVHCRLETKSLTAASRWLGSRERLWASRLDALGEHLAAQEHDPLARSATGRATR